MAIKRRQLLILGGLVLGGGVGGAAFSGILSRKPEAIAPTDPKATIASNAKPTKSVSTVKRSLNPAPKGLFAPTRGDVRIVLISDLNSAYGSTDYIDQVKQAIASGLRLKIPESAAPLTPPPRTNPPNINNCRRLIAIGNKISN